MNHGERIGGDQDRSTTTYGVAMLHDDVDVTGDDRSEADAAHIDRCGVRSFDDVHPQLW